MRNFGVHLLGFTFGEPEPEGGKRLLLSPSLFLQYRPGSSVAGLGMRTELSVLFWNRVLLKLGRTRKQLFSPVRQRGSALP